MERYRVIVTSRLYPNGVSYPGSGQTLYTRERAITVMRTMAERGIPSDYDSEYGSYAESATKRFTLADLGPARDSPQLSAQSS